MSAGRAERACPAPLPLATLVDHWAGELAPADEAAVEEHLMACGACAERAAWLGRLAATTRELIARGRVPLVLTPALLARLERDGVRIRRHVVEAGGQTRCTAGPDDDLIAVMLRAPLRAGERVDLVYLEAPAGLDSVRAGPTSRSTSRAARWCSWSRATRSAPCRPAERGSASSASARPASGRSASSPSSHALGGRRPLTRPEIASLRGRRPSHPRLCLDPLERRLEPLGGPIAGGIRSSARLLGKGELSK